MAGVLMLTPGFITDIVGFALLFPPTRAIARTALLRRFTARMGQGLTFMGGGRRGVVYDTTVRNP
jgi:UPF0716 protein FxsA